MGQEIQIKNPKFLLSENLETFARKDYPNAKIKASHSFNKIEIQDGEIKTEIRIESDLYLIKISSEVQGTGIKLWLFVILALPYRILDRFQIIDFHFIIEILYYGSMLFLASVPGNEKARDWEKARKKKEKEIEEFVNKWNAEFGLKEKSKEDNTLFKKEVQSLIGLKIKEVCYFSENEFNYDYDSIHLVDLGVTLKLENDKFLSWKFENEEINIEDDLLIPKRYDIKFTNVFEESESSYTLENVSENPYWKALINEPIVDIKIYSQEIGKNKLITDLIIETTTSKVAVFSIDEPTESEEQLDINLAIGNDFTVVVFDEEKIKSSNRIESMIPG